MVRAIDPKRWGARGWSGAGLTVVICLVTVLVIVGHNRRDHLDNLREAGEAMRAGDAATAHEKLQAALRQDPESVEAVELMTEWTRRYGLQDELEWARRSWNLSPDIKNLSSYVRATLKWGRPEDALLLLESESTQQAVSPGDRAALLTAVFAAMGKFDQAATLIEEAVTHGYALTDEFHLTRAVLHSRSGGNRKEALVALDEIEPTSSLYAEALKVRLRILLEEPEAELVKEAALELCLAEGVAPEARMGGLEVLRQYDPARVPDVLRRLEDRFEGNPAAGANLVSWAFNYGFSEWAEERIANLGKHLLQDPHWGMVAAAAAFRSGRGDESDRLLGEIQLDPQDPFRLLLSAGQERASGRSDSVNRSHLLSQVVARIGEQPGLQRRLREFAFAYGLEAEMEEIWWKTARSGESVEASRHLYLLYQSRRDTRGLRRVMAFVSARAPDDLVARNNLAMLDLLLGENHARAHRLAKEVYQAEPLNPAFCATFAYSLSLQGEASQAVTVIESLSPEALNTAEVRLYYAVALHANGEISRAREVVKEIDSVSFLNEELSLAESIRTIY